MYGAVRTVGAVSPLSRNEVNLFENVFVHIIMIMNYIL